MGQAKEVQKSLMMGQKRGAAGVRAGGMQMQLHIPSGAVNQLSGTVVS